MKKYFNLEWAELPQDMRTAKVKEFVQSYCDEGIEKECPTCKGRGQIGDPLAPCALCAGAGHIAYDPTNLEDLASAETQISQRFPIYFFPAGNAQ